MRTHAMKMPAAGLVALALAGLLTALVASPAQAGTGGRTTVLVHVTSVPDAGNDQFFSIPHLALEVLKRDHRMIILFDGSGANLAKLGHWYGGDTTLLLDKIQIEEAELELLARHMGISTDSMPENYGNLIRMLRDRGVEFYVNHDAMRRLGIDDDECDTVMVPVEEEQVLNQLAAADVYISY